MAPRSEDGDGQPPSTPNMAARKDRYDGGEDDVRQAALEKELRGVRSINEVIEGVIGTLEKAKGNMDTVSTTVDNASTLLNTWTRILSQTEHNQRLILNPDWKGATQDLMDIENGAIEKQQAAQRRAAEEERRRAEARRKQEEDERKRQAAATSSRGTRRTRSRGRAGYTRGTTSSSNSTLGRSGSTRGASGNSTGRYGNARYGRVRGTNK
ncbi:uncharacterized protein MKZ38_004293 [Zalerion maritima]|uniref:DASH complex subunit DUO1 n=1 Tax=Zalerion maritima TaxID=339359 RepID=A0AAD5RMS7_9PEZI|nr:uncharacterized protein MKZ38_004293 [Zalerion maritima]